MTYFSGLNDVVGVSIRSQRYSSNFQIVEYIYIKIKMSEDVLSQRVFLILYCMRRQVICRAIALRRRGIDPMQKWQAMALQQNNLITYY